MRILISFLVCFWDSVAQAQDLRLAVTTSFQNSGLAEAMMPVIAADTGLSIDILVVGTGQALRLARSGDVDAVLVHARQAEEDHVAKGFATHRREIMYNDFVLVGPRTDPAGIMGAQTAREALTRIAQAQFGFISRGDDSGTHKKERSLWGDLDPDGSWYREIGAGMGAALNMASGLGAYVLTDRASWLNFGNKGDLALLFAGDKDLFNQYAYLPTSPARLSTAQADATKTLETWLVSDAAQEVIDSYRINGTQVFTFNAVR